MHDIFTFRKMMTPTLIMILFLLAVAVSIFIAVGFILTGLVISLHDQNLWGLFLVFPGVVFLVVGPFLARIFCELLILSFRMYETLVEINNRLGAPPL